MSFHTRAADCEDVSDYSNSNLLFGEKKILQKSQCIFGYFLGV